MPRIVSIPSRGVQVEFPDSLPDEEIDAYLAEKYPRSGEDVAFEVEQAKKQAIEGGNWVNPFDRMSRDDYILFRQNLANKKTSLGDFLGIATDAFTNVIDEIGTGIKATAYTTAQGEFGKVAESVGEGIVAGTIGLADIAAKILTPTAPIPKKEEFIGKAADPKSAAFLGMGGMGNTFKQGVNTEADYNALIEQEKQRDVDAINRLYAIEATLKGAPVEEIARGAQNIDPAILTGLGSAAVRSLATKLAGKSIFKPVATAAARTATAPGGLGQAALSGIERAASGVQTAASLPGQALQGIRNVAERVAPGTGAALQGTALATGLMADMGLTAGTLAGAATAEKAAEVVGAAARAARKEASRVGLLEQAAQDAAISPAARKLAGGLAQLQPVFRGASQAAAQALKEGAAGAAVGAGLGYLAERNLEGAAQGAGAGAAFGGLTGTMRSVFDMGREMVGGSTSRTRQQAAGDLNTFLAERPEVEQAAWSQTINRLVEQVGPERAAAQVDAMKIAEANGAKVRVATPDEMKQWQNPGWVDTENAFDLVLNPERILGDTAAHETSHVLFSSAINRAFKPEIEQAVFGLADPVTGEIVRPGLFDDIALAKVADQIGDAYGDNTKAANRFKGYANVLRNTTDAASLEKARTSIADEMSAAYTGNLFGRLRPGRFNPDRLPLVYRNALNALEDSILDKFRSVLFEKGMDLGFDSVSRTFKDAKGKPIRIPELDAIVKRALAKRGTKAAQAPTAKPDLIPVNPADRAIWARSYGGARGILNDYNTPKTAAQIQAEATARWQDMTQRMAALPETERKGIEFNRDSTGKTVMTAKGQLSPEALNVILDSGTLDPSAKAVLRDVLTSMQNFNKATFDTRYYGVYDRGIGRSKMVAGVKSVSQNEILPYSVEMNSKEGVIIRAVDMTKVRDRLATALTKPQFKDVYASSEAALKDFNLYLENITQINPVDSATLLGGGEKGAKKRNLFYDALGFRLRNNESLRNAPESIISKSQNTVKSYRVERFAKLQDSGNRFAFEEATTYERAMKNFQPDAFARETLPAGETLTNPDGYRILKKAGSKLFRVYDDQGELIGVAKNELGAMQMAQRKFIDGWHGSPHNFMRFMAQKIGAGEGRQDFGYGLYIAESPIVAKGYKERLSSTPQPLGNRVYDLTGFKVGEGIIRKLLPLESLNEIEAARSSNYDLKQVGSPSELKRIADASRQASKESAEGGSLYRVQLNVSPEQLLDWDKPLSEQSENVRNAITKAAPSVKPYGIPIDHNPTGAEIYGMISTPSEVGPKKTSELLKSLGIPGIRYFDQRSRSSGEGTRNYVIFDDGLIRIIDRNGKSVGKRLFRDVAEEGYNVRFQPDDFAKKASQEERQTEQPLQPSSPETPDIRFQPDPLSPNIQVGSNGARIIKSPSGKFRVYSVTGTLLGIRETEQAAKKLATK